MSAGNPAAKRQRLFGFDGLIIEQYSGDIQQQGVLDTQISNGRSSLFLQSSTLQ